ncbi:protein of unknown function [Candidatus Filomicrobium marinum]|nr:protein of unknown function [Candidatus Filomicrobium marinum]
MKNVPQVESSGDRSCGLMIKRGSVQVLVRLQSHASICLPVTIWGWCRALTERSDAR